MRTASVAVVGAGVIGASVAYHLAARGLTDMLLLDRAARPGTGSTGFATGGFRIQFDSPVNVNLSVLAREKLLAFEEETGVDPLYRPVGYLWLAQNDAEMDALRHARDVEHAHGPGQVVELEVNEALRRNPALDPAHLSGATFCRQAGFLDPRRMLDGYLAAAGRRDVHLESDTLVTGFTRDGTGRIRTLRTQREEIAVERVVNAAGAWASEIAALAGVELPVVPVRRQVAVTRPFEGLPPDMPMTLFVGDGFHLRVRDGRVLLLKPSPGVPGRPFDTSVERDWVTSVFELACRRIPALRAAVIDEAACYAGLYEMSPDKHALLGAAPGCANLYLANGSSGHGVMHSPALGHLLAEILLDGRASTLNVEALRPGRFAEGAPNPSDGLL
ncbi:MAG: NAD(P)/FAD-dependent oxidoreductase [Candidatus Eiseniibacteriota bacterium]